jgi:rhodanese-related sulfurtransferase/DNA-binding transcriptional ArsR family regulator
MSTTETTQTRIFTEHAELARTLGHAHRLLLLEHVAQGERAVDRLAELTAMSLANASQHLQQLKRSGFVVSRRDGKNMLYRLADGPVAPLLAALRDLADHNRARIGALVSEAAAQRDGLDAVTRDELVARLGDGDVVVLDVRPTEEYAQGHLPGAISLPADEIERRIAELPRDRMIVAYCRGPYCVLSTDAVAALRARGYDARRLADGFPQWKAAGLSVETQPAD